MRTPRRCRGFTLAEVLLAAAVLAVAVIAITQAVVAGQAASYAALHDSRGLALAEALMEEIVALPYDDPDGGGGLGPEAGENDRTQFDNADDFDGYEESIGDVVDVAGNAYPVTFERFSREVTASFDTNSTADFGDVDGLTVTVTVTDDKGRVWTISRFIAEPGT